MDVNLYVPDHFLNKERELELIRNYPFATVVSSKNGELEISRIPLLLKPKNGRLFLEGHFARANPHWRSLESTTHTYIMFNAAHGYISPTWYLHLEKNVPTWNYSTVVVSTKPLIIEDPEWIKRSLVEMADYFEKNDKWISEVDKNYFKSLLKNVVGLNAEVISMKSKFKLSQNRDKEDQKRVYEKLMGLNKELADEMKLWGKL